MSEERGHETVSVYVRNLSYNTQIVDLRRLFERHGKVRDVYIPRDFYSGRPRGFAYVEFYDTDEAKDAVRRLNGQHILGRDIVVEFARGDRKTPKEMRYDGRSDRGSGKSRDVDESGRDRRKNRRRSDSRSRSRTRSRSRSRSSRKVDSKRSSRDENGSSHRHHKKRRDASPSRSRSRTPSVRSPEADTIKGSDHVSKRHHRGSRSDGNNSRSPDRVSATASSSRRRRASPSYSKNDGRSGKHHRHDSENDNAEADDDNDAATPENGTAVPDDADYVAATRVENSVSPYHTTRR